MAVAMIRISFEALAVAGFGPGEAIGLSLGAEAAQAVIRRTQVVVAVGVVRIGVGRLHELLQGFLVLAALIERHAVGIATIGNEVGAAASRRQALPISNTRMRTRLFFPTGSMHLKPGSIAEVGRAPH